MYRHRATAPLRHGTGLAELTGISVRYPDMLKPVPIQTQFSQNVVSNLNTQFSRLSAIDGTPKLSIGQQIGNDWRSPTRWSMNHPVRADPIEFNWRRECSGNAICQGKEIPPLTLMTAPETWSESGLERKSAVLAISDGTFKRNGARASILANALDKT